MGAGQAVRVNPGGGAVFPIHPVSVHVFLALRDAFVKDFPNECGWKFQFGRPACPLVAQSLVDEYDRWRRLISARPDEKAESC